MTDDHRGGASRHVEVDVDGAGVATLTFRDEKGLRERFIDRGAAR